MFRPVFKPKQRDPRVQTPAIEKWHPAFVLHLHVCILSKGNIESVAKKSKQVLGSFE